MASEISKAVGHKAAPLDVTWNQRDLLLYVAGIGAKYDELDLTFELNDNWKPFPTYPLVTGFKGDSQDVVNFAESLKGRAGDAPPGMPELDPNKVVHAEQSIKILRPLPKEARPEDGWKLLRSTGGVHDKGKGLIIETVSTLVDGKGTEYCHMVSASYNFGKFDLGGFSKSISPKLSVQTKKQPPAKDPDFVAEDKTTKEQALVYRLSGDYNPLHIDPSIGKKLGFGGVILHGLCFYGIAARAIVRHVAKGDGSRLLEMGGRFTSPVLPGQTLLTHIWTQPAKDGNIQVDFAQQIKETGKWSLAGCALVAKGSTNSKL
ncbi:hypothetical protein P389DRAFT_154347 [Cystobasidium minutum MCA 4210]|uniref:uncharacterized protein n=1 Tax=Cystobasidium minutum MCA 4210 TaxID=1397322 RepID=UPI0034CD2B46|eukprot:jgi/Rhomi1/154347/estExt_Genewise1.C_5_t20408